MQDSRRSPQFRVMLSTLKEVVKKIINKHRIHFNIQSKYFENIISFLKQRGGGFKKQENKETRNSSRLYVFVFLMNNFITTNRNEVKFCFSPTIGPNKIVPTENNNILVETLVSLFSLL